MISMPYTNIKLVYESNYEYDMEVTLLSEFIILDTFEKKIFSSLKYEYIIETFVTYPITQINNPNQIIDKHLSGLIKDIYLITNPYTKTIIKSDSRFNNYINLVSNNSPPEASNIITENEIEYANWVYSENKSSFSRINNLVNNFSNIVINFPKEYNLIKFLMYYEDKYLSSELSINRKNYIILFYLKYQFYYQTINCDIPRINTLIFHGNGTELFSRRDNMYFNYVIPYIKFKNTLPVNYYVYSFSLNPLDEQFSGHQNFTNFDDSSITISSNSDIFEQYDLQIIVKQYNVLKIISGIGNLLF
jgi:hypothetical protein